MSTINDALKPTIHKNLGGLLSEVQINKILHELGWHKHGTYLADKALEIINGLVVKQKKLINDYFNRTASLAFLANLIIQYIYTQNIKISKEKMLPSLIKYEEIMNSAVENMLMAVADKKKINILGFGIRQGSYEKQIKNFLIEKHKILDADIYGFDPNKIPDFPIINLSQQQLFSENCPFFDLIIVRWTLHHVDETYRWKDLLRCVNQTKKGSKIIIIEEGTFSDVKDCSFNVLMKNFLFSIADIIANFIYNSKWIDAILQKKENPFYIKYLTSQDIESIENSFQFQSVKTVTSINGFYIPLTIFEYTVLEEIKP